MQVAGDLLGVAGAVILVGAVSFGLAFFALRARVRSNQAEVSISSVVISARAAGRGLPLPALPPTTSAPQRRDTDSRCRSSTGRTRVRAFSREVRPRTSPPGVLCKRRGILYFAGELYRIIAPPR